VPSPLVSIIVPCYNAEQYVGEAIRSALGQTYPNVEVIVIDDGSTDGSLEGIGSFGEAIRWETGPNRGGSAARNRGLALARGELVQFLDADDLLDPEKLALQVPPVVAGKADVVYCDWQTVEIDRPDRVRRFSSPYDGEDPVCFILKRQLQTAAPIHWKRRLESVGGWDERLTGSQEFDLHLRLACADASLHYLPEPLLVVRTRPDSVSSNFVRTISQQLCCVPAIYERLKRDGRLSDERACAFAERMARNARGCLQRGARDVALSFFVEAKRMHRSGGLRGAYRPYTRLLHHVL